MGHERPSAATADDGDLVVDQTAAYRFEWLVVAGVAVLALGVRLWSIRASGGLLGYLNSDDGAYFGSSHALVNGLVPYRDFLLLHPPGVAIFYAPVAELGRFVSEARTLELARLLAVGVGVLNSLLAYRIARRLGPVAGAVAGLTYAVWFSAVYVERTTLLEPLTNLALLVALLLLGRPALSTRVAVGAGVALGLGVTVKVWGLVPLVVVVVWLLLARGRRPALLVLAGALGAVVVVLGPFAVADPAAMLRMVVLDQWGRDTGAGPDPGRLASMLGLVGEGGPRTLGAVLAWALVVAAVVVAARAHPIARLWVALLAAQVLMLMETPLYFRHYGAVLAPPLVLVLGAAAQVVVLRLSGTPTWRLIGWRALAVVAASGLLLGQLVVVAGDPSGKVFPRGRVKAATVGSTCVTSDSATAIILAGHFRSNVENGCPVVVDFTGLSYESYEVPLLRIHNDEFQRRALDYLQQGDHVVLVRLPKDGLTAATMAELALRPVVMKGRYVTVLGPLPS